MEKSPKALWDNCLKLIKENVTEQQFRTWFATLVFEQYDEDSRTLLVQVPSRYVYEYLEQYYVQLLSMALRRCFGAQVQLNYRIVVDKKHHLTIDEAGSEPVNIEEPARTERANKAPTALDAAVPQDLNPQLDKHKTFQSFIEGDSNKLPRTVGRRSILSLSSDLPAVARRTSSMQLVCVVRRCTRRSAYFMSRHASSKCSLPMPRVAIR